jgi:hypothetical protein
MKRYFIYAVVLTCFAFTVFSCKKQSIAPEEPLITDTVPNDPTIYPDPAVTSKGMMTGKVMPETKFSLLLYNDDNSYAQFTIVNRTGSFLIKDIEAGNYTLLIQPVDPSLNPIELTKITVDPGRTTNMGLIFLP